MPVLFTVSASSFNRKLIRFILGSSTEESRRLRGENGQLQTFSQGGIHELPLQDRDSQSYCKSQNPNINKCFLSGSKTVNLLPGKFLDLVYNPIFKE